MIDLSDPRHQRALRRVNELARDARAMFRTVGPRISLADNAQDWAAIMHCHRCTPAPEVYECPQCNQQFAERWQYRLHIKADPRYCLEWMRRRAAAYAKAD